MKVWTVYNDFYETGAGRSISALICYAQDIDEARSKYERLFNHFFARMAQIEEGVVVNEITQYLFNEKVLTDAQRFVNKANLELYSSFHFNAA